MKRAVSQKLAVFDIDGTLFRSSLLIELVHGLVDAGVFPEKARKEMEADYLAWINRRGNYENYISQVVRIHQHYIAGAGVQSVRQVVLRVIDWQKDRVYRYTRDLLGELKKKNYYLLAISGSPAYIVSQFADHMGFADSIAREFSVRGGMFTGENPNDEYLRRKDQVLKDFITHSGIRADLGRSIAVGDTEGDIPMLELVGKPIAFNPNTTLAAYAKRKNWQIVVERKDVIYEIRDFSALSGGGKLAKRLRQ
ncbi:MAG: HAD family phosphatase [bacterium]|nr:HAD family phosphatase [bacterium]